MGEYIQQNTRIISLTGNRTGKKKKNGPILRTKQITLKEQANI
jgi:hypothetical protein